MADFKAWVRMMGSNGSSQQVIHFRVASAPNLAALTERLNAKDFILVEQLWQQHGAWSEAGQITLNRRAFVRIQPLKGAADLAGEP